MPSNDVVGNTGAALPWQIEYMFMSNDGVMFGFTVTESVAGNAHCPAVGVNVYVPELLLLTTAGLQVPLIPFVDVPGNVGTLPPAQTVNDVPKPNAGVMFGAVDTVNVVDTAHWPVVGVNVCVPELLGSTTAGFHAPFTPFVDVVGKVGTAPPAQIFNDVPKLNVGVRIGLTVTLNVVGKAH